ncbi:hypothetical protein ACVWVY_008704 [Bradyrhizobium sp. URHC0002]
MGAAVVEAQSRAGYQILHCARHQDLASTGKRRDPRTNVNSDTANIVTNHFALARVEPRPYLYAERLDFLGNGTGAANAAGWTVEGGEKAVSSCFHFMASKSR